MPPARSIRCWLKKKARCRGCLARARRLAEENRGGHYFITFKGESKVDKKELTQVGRALPRLGITLIPSYSPQARGRMERVFGTL